MSKKTKRLIIIAVALILLTVLAVILYELTIARPGRKKTLPALPGKAVSADEYDPDLYAPGLLKIMDSRLLVPVQLDDRVEVSLLSSSYTTSPKRGEEGTRSGLYLASDQIMYGRGLVKMNKRSDFLDWVKAFDLAFLQKDGFHAAFRDAEGQVADSHWSVTLAFTRALLEGYDAFGGSYLVGEIELYSSLLLPVFRENNTADELLAGPRALLAYDDWDTPPPGTLPTPGESAPLEQARGTYLADVDLWALLALSRFDSAWAPIASEWKRIVTSARSESPLPLYASAVSDDKENYFLVTGDELLSRTTEQLKIAIHLAEVGVVDRDFLSLIRSSLRDNKKLTNGWNPVSGSAASAEAVPSDYALALILGRAADDPLLIQSAFTVMMYSYASSQTSDIVGGWYRPGDSARVFRLVATDNVAVMNAIR